MREVTCHEIVATRPQAEYFHLRRDIDAFISCVEKPIIWKTLPVVICTLGATKVAKAEIQLSIQQHIFRP